MADYVAHRLAQRAFWQRRFPQGHALVMNLGGPRIGVLAAQGQTLVDARLLLACVTIHEEQGVYVTAKFER